MNVKDRIAIVTGSGRGIGAAIIKRLGANGAVAVVSDIDGSTAEQTAAEIRNAGGQAIALQADVTKKDQVEAMVQQVVERYGRLDILVNNVGIIRDNYLTKMAEEDWDKVLDVNLKSYFLCSQAAVKQMMGQKSGRIVNITSRAWLGNPGQANYSAAKAGIVGLTRVIALESGRYGITCNAVAPGVIDTPMTQGLTPEVQERLMKAQPIRKIGQPEDIAYAVQFLAADEAWYISGQVIYVCGGKSLGSVMG